MMSTSGRLAEDYPPVTFGVIPGQGIGEAYQMYITKVFNRQLGIGNDRRVDDVLGGNGIEVGTTANSLLRNNNNVNTQSQNMLAMATGQIRQEMANMPSQG